MASAPLGQDLHRSFLTVDDALVNVLDEEKEGEIRNVDAVSQGWLVSEDKKKV